MRAAQASAGDPPRRCGTRRSMSQQGCADRCAADRALRIDVVLSGVRMPRMNSIMERWIQTCRRELLDRTLVWNQTHLLHVLRQYERHHNEHRPHRGISNSRPLQALPDPMTDPNEITNLVVRRRDRLGGILHEYEHVA